MFVVYIVISHYEVSGLGEIIIVSKHVVVEV